MSDAPLPELSLDLFEPLLGQTFQIGEDNDAIDTVLIQTTNLREAQGAGRLSQQFSLLWRGPAGANLVQLYTGFIYAGPALPARINAATRRGRVAEGDQR